MWPDPPAPPRQATPAPAPRQPPPPAASARQPAPRAADKPATARTARRTHKRAEPVRAIACSGPFARDANHARLEAAFGAGNVVFGQVDAPGGTKLNASIVFPDDPKQRLEVLWHDEAARANPSAIVITGASRWTAPQGMRLGLAMAQVEKRNGKPFKLSGFGGELGGNVSDWDGGKLDQLGACRMGMRFTQNPKASAEMLTAASGEKQFLSSGAEMRAVSPRVSEIVVGYTE
jgi:hypothetical protein